jgi:excisionase family DNA binding protein
MEIETKLRCRMIVKKIERKSYPEEDRIKELKEIGKKTDEYLERIKPKTNPVFFNVMEKALLKCYELFSRVADLIDALNIVERDVYFSLERLSTYSSMSISTLRRYIRKDDFPVYKTRGKVLVKRSDFDAWLQRFRVKKSYDLDKLSK